MPQPIAPARPAQSRHDWPRPELKYAGLFIEPTYPSFLTEADDDLDEDDDTDS
jgi:hypothetical protein